MLKVGNTELRHGLFLGPMAGYSDYAMRTIAREHGAEYLTSEMVSAKALVYQDSSSAPLAHITKGELPCAVQIFGHEPEIMAKAAAMIASGRYGEIPSAIDINMGCPVHKIVSGGDGSALLKKPDLAREIVAAVKSAVDIPVTVKMRIGYEAGSNIAAAFAKELEAGGADLICVHGRTRAQGYSGEVNIAAIRQVAEAVSVPIVGNGDIRTVESAMRMLLFTRCRGIMIGRAAVGNPFIFSEIAAALDGRPYTPPSAEERYAVATRQLELAIADKGETIAVLESRKQIGGYLAGYRDAAIARSEINRATTAEEVLGILRRVLFGA